MNWIKFAIALCVEFGIAGVFCIITWIVSYFVDEDDCPAFSKAEKVIRNRLIIRLVITVPITALLFAAATAIL